MLYVSEFSLAGTRLVLVAVVADLIDGVTGAVPAVDVVITRVGDEGFVPIGDRLVPTMAMVTLGLDDAFGGRSLLLLLVLGAGSAMLAEFGLVLGMWAKDANTLFTAIKGGGIFIFLPVIFTVWPNLPQWIPRLAPTYYFLNPVYEVGVLGAGPGDGWSDIVVAVAICLVMAPLVMAYGRRAERRLAIAL